MFNESLDNAALFNDSGVFVAEMVTAMDPGVSFTISDELGGFEEAISDECMC
jgi:hypothetical protein